MRRYAFSLLISILIFYPPTWAHAQTCSATASAIDFGHVSPISLSAVSATGTVAVTCKWPRKSSTPNALACLNLNATNPLSLKNGSNAMRYDLYQNAAHSLKWGSASNGTTPISLTLTKPASGSSSTKTVTVYGVVPGNQPTVPTVGNSPTSYSDSFAGTAATLDYGYYGASPPSCASVASSVPISLNVSATVIADCNINATNVNFPATTTTGAALSATGSIMVQCTAGDAWRLALNGGSSGNVADRRMQRSGGGGAIGYQLYTSAAHTAIWGDGTSGTTMQSGTGTGNAAAIIVYGHVPAQATPAPGAYSDAITAVISF